MGPLLANYHSDKAYKDRAALLAEADQMVQKHGKIRGISELNDREEKPAPKPRSKSRDKDETEHCMKAESRKFHQQIASNMENLVNNAERNGYGYRGKSADYIAKNNRDSSLGSKGSKKESYIQKLIGLNRTGSASSGSKYPFAVPPWQKLLKGNSESSQHQVSVNDIKRVTTMTEGSEKKEIGSFGSAAKKSPHFKTLGE